ncbi:MAG TPA: response regulator [Nitrososphaeraceae archaeon]|jgi:DNA-binding response OmpR family regulator|nr:response regulator [Nitrososphaeraceae archaeon]
MINKRKYKKENKNIKIMIIEDELDILLLYKDYLNNKGFSVLATSTTANEALKDYENFFPQLLILDYNLPGKTNGLEAARQILDKYPTVPIIIVTAHEIVKNELSQDQFFTNKKIILLFKPIKLHILESNIKNLLIK